MTRTRKKVKRILNAAVIRESLGTADDILLVYDPSPRGSSKRMILPGGDYTRLNNLAGLLQDTEQRFPGIELELIRLLPLERSFLPSKKRDSPVMRITTYVFKSQFDAPTPSKALWVPLNRIYDASDITKEIAEEAYDIYKYRSNNTIKVSKI